MELAEEFRMSQEAADANDEGKESRPQRRSKRSLVTCLDRKAILCF